MHSGAEGSVRTKMVEVRLVCDREIPIQQQRMDATVASFHKSLLSVKDKAQQSVQNQETLGKLKAQLRDADDDLVKALTVKTRKEAKGMAILESISATKAKVEELKRFVENQKARKNEYAEIIAKQSEALLACEASHDREAEHTEEIEDAISWYNKVLGFQIECGHGVKFIFTSINSKNQKEEYSFTIRHENDSYSLLGCDPQLDGTKELIHDLNRSNGLFKFVRTMREKFQEAASRGTFSLGASVDQDCSTISASAPVSSVSTGIKDESQPESETNRHSKIANRGSGSKSAILSPGSAASFRQSPRFKVKK